MNVDVIPAHDYVIPAQAGIHVKKNDAMLQANFVPVDKVAEHLFLPI